MSMQQSSKDKHRSVLTGRIKARYGKVTEDVPSVLVAELQAKLSQVPEAIKQ